MCQFDSFALIGKDDRVISYDIAASHGMHADFFLGASAHDTLAPMADDFIPQNLNPKAYSSQEQDRILAASNLAYPGDTVVIEFTPDQAGVHPYICTYSGHFTMMQGRIYVEP